MAMSSSLNGEASVSVTTEDSQIYLVVASVPDFFGSYQHYPYRVRILEGGECLYEQKLILHLCYVVSFRDQFGDIRS